MVKDKGILIIVSGPSGSGKGSICSELNNKRIDIEISISATSRNPRKNDVEGKSYYFRTTEQFEEMIRNDELLEWVKYCDNYYGTPRKSIDEKLNEGKNVILEIEVVGALSVKDRYPDSVLIFILPPSYDELIERLRTRGTEDDTVIRKRITKAIEEINAIEKYDYLVINDTVSNAAIQIEAILDAEKNRAYRNIEKIKYFIQPFKEV